MGWESTDVFRFDLGPILQGQRWFTGFGELSFRWIQICIGSPMHWSSFLGRWPDSLRASQDSIQFHMASL